MYGCYNTWNCNLWWNWFAFNVLGGGEFLDYAELESILPVSREMARYHAMLGVEIGVGFTVTAIMFALYANLSTAGRLKGGL